VWSAGNDGDMSNLDSAVAEVLAPAVIAARKALGDMGFEEIPAPLRKIAARQGGRLPPPLARRVILELDRDEWLRSKAAEVLAEGTADAATVAFLERPEGWWATVATAAAEQRARGEVDRGANLERRIDELSVQLGEAKRRLKRAKVESAAAARRAEGRIEELRGRLRGAGASEGGNEPTPKAQIADLQRRLEAERDLRATAEADAASCRQDVRRLRRERADAERRLAARGSSSLPSDPIELARFLDLQVAGLGRSAPQALDTSGAPLCPKLPAGIAPDSSEAMRWLLSQGSSLTVIVDGYNVLHQLEAAGPSARGGRRRLNDELRRWRRLSASPLRVVVVYDSSSPEPRRARSGVSGLEIRFAAEDRSADEEVVELAGVVEGPVVVISSDREIRDHAEAAGALTLWTEALVNWVTGR